ncbi:hypothetical protein Hypma_011140 [Hypsizygus marmoreus]|uniref:Uncharacterized protein n=1 Tax=Hypsizygus marmoreus TaxID=39966 RepID=A0A369JNC4_HYPMA|nr:hypothetical protein Hypma_011140 [Hypsizygus marmoreus]
MACNLFGNLRQPEDLDILCLTTEWEQEALKSKLVALNSNFYLIDSRDPTATYRVLWYLLTDTDSCVKVDLLFPGVLDIPSIPGSSITRANAYHLPCAPLSLVLLLKLQAWNHHSEALEYRYRAKQPTDARDIEALLPIASKMGLQLRSDAVLPQSFVSKSIARAEKFMRVVPSSRAFWEKLGMVEKAKPVPIKTVLPMRKPGEVQTKKTIQVTIPKSVVKPSSSGVRRPGYTYDFDFM